MDTARDISIIVLAVFSIVQAVTIAGLMIALMLLVRVLRKKVLPIIDMVPPLLEQVNPILDTAKSTVQSVESSARQVQVGTVFATEKAIRPVITVASFFAGARATAIALTDVLTGRRKARGKRR